MGGTASSPALEPQCQLRSAFELFVEAVDLLERAEWKLAKERMERKLRVDLADLMDTASAC